MVTRWGLFLALLLAAGGALAEPGEQDAILGVTRLDFTASDDNTDPGPMRVLVYAGGLRIDAGAGSTDYTYFDRKARKIYSVSQASRVATVYPAKGKPHEETLKAYLHGLEVESEAQDQQGLPKVGEYQTRALTLTANGVPCATAIIAPGLLPEVSKVMRDYLKLLAVSAKQAAVSGAREGLEDCALAVDVVKPDWPLRTGFPVVLENFRGERRFLENYTADVPVETGVFQVPDGYEIRESKIVKAGPEAQITEPEVTEPEVTEPEVTEPEVTEPEVTEPEVTEPEVTEPEVTEPEVTEPEVTEPEVTEPDVTEPEVTESEVTEAEVTEPEVTESEVTESEVTEPEVTEPEVTEPEVTEPEVAEPEVTEPEVTEPEVTEPEVTEPEATEPEATEPEATEPEATEPEVIEPEVIEPEVIEPEVTEPEVTEPEAIEGEVTEPEVTGAEVTDPAEASIPAMAPTAESADPVTPWAQTPPAE
ncbi:hypothetical protein Q4485_10700 [Granulosicoccaceae sp. 1_MG-2023]|nr:hypothetical protein [Granulosicoccaceae sp. 1_MG-2023]